MIIRVLRGSVASDEGAALAEYLRREVLPNAPSVEGLLSFHVGLREAGDRTRMLSVGVWNELDELERSPGELDRPAWIDRSGLHVSVDSVDFYELTGRNFPSFGRMGGEIIRVFDATVGSNGEAALQEQIRNRQESLADHDALLAFHLGRRVGETDTETVVIAVWRDRDALQRLGSAALNSSGSEDPGRWILNPRLETYEAPTGSIADTGAGVAQL